MYLTIFVLINTYTYVDTMYHVCLQCSPSEIVCIYCLFAPMHREIIKKNSKKTCLLLPNLLNIPISILYMWCRYWCRYTGINIYSRSLDYIYHLDISEWRMSTLSTAIELAHIIALLVFAYILLFVKNIYRLL